MPDRYAQVAVNIPVDRTFDYAIPEHLLGRVRPGVIVRVPFGPRRLAGDCVGTAPKPRFTPTKPIAGLVEDDPVFAQRDLDLARWIAEEYAAGIGEVLEAMLPAAVRRGKARPAQEFVGLTDAAETPRRLGAKQQAIIDVLAKAEGAVLLAEVLELAEASRPSLNALVKAGLAAIERRDVDPWSEAVDVTESKRHDLTGPQTEAVAQIVEAVVNRRFQGFLLLGVTGSGKTEVYLRAIEKVVAGGRQAIVLIPEIVLTPQTVSRFLGRFDRVAVLHSHLTATERHAQWRAIARGDAQVIIGARSAVFAPTRDLGIIVIDEEHETSFKQDNAPRYHAREVAMHRARLGNFPVVLGSATPSLESFHRAVEGDWRLLELPDRVEDRPLPEVELVDMVEERAMRKGRFILARRLATLLGESLERGEQAMLFLNRRGFTTHLFCPTCGFVLQCKRCAVSLIHHKRENAGVCHYCGSQTAIPDICPECKLARVVQVGMGTERIDEDIRTLYPEASVQRMDGDTMSRRGAHDEVHRRIRAGEIDIIVGTQLIAKGHDFPDVTLVGVIDADTGLHFPDFRARERTFQLMTQVAGRTGRSEKGGRVVIQTHHPDDPSIRAAATHDYMGFARAELADRKARGYPPYVRLVRIVVDGPVEADVAQRGSEIREALVPAGEEETLEVLGPVAAPIARIKGRFRYHLAVKLPPGAAAAPLLKRLPRKTSRRGGIAVTIDVDPINML